ncbi:adherens junction protein p120 isoform X1 [Rhodnius prolixus]
MSNSQLVDSCLRVLQEKGQDMPQYIGQPDMEQTSTYSTDLVVGYHPSNGHVENHSPVSSHLVLESGSKVVDGVGVGVGTGQARPSVASVTCDVHQLTLDGGVDYVTVPQYQYEHLAGQAYHPDQARHYVGYHDYEHYPYPAMPTYPSYTTARYPVNQDYSERPPTPPSPSEKSESSQHGVRWRDPNLTEVISFLTNPNNVIKANAAAYLQHLCYMDDPNKQKTRVLGGIPPLVNLLGHDTPDVYRNACGALRNLSYGRQNDENKRAIKSCGGIPLLMNLLRKSSDAEVKELVTGVLWNLSSCEDLKRAIIDDGLPIIVNQIIIPHSGWGPNSGGDTCWSTVFRNTSGVLRNVSSAGEYARKRLRECEGLVDSMLYVVRLAIEKSNIGNKSVENCVCILRNLSYRCQEVEDPNYDKNPLPAQPVKVSAHPKGDNLGCFGASKKKKDSEMVVQKETTSSRCQVQRNEPLSGMELLWQPEVVQSYLCLLQSCSNPETLEAAAGALQNLAACYWQPSIEIRAAVRKEKGLPILVELLRMEVDRVVCAVATALRNLAIDQRNKELIGKYAMRDLVQKLPSGNPQHDQGTSDDTIAAVLATLNEVIKKNAEFSRSLLESGGVERLMNITRQRQKYTPRVLKFAGQVLYTMWQHQELREVYRKHGWKEHDFVTKTVAARNAGPNSPSNANSTLNRPMASQGGTRYEDRSGQGVTPDSRVAAPSLNIHPVKPGEPLYAQVNREKKKSNRSGVVGPPVMGMPPAADANAASWAYDETAAKGLVVDPASTPGGDSWV